MTLDGDVDLRHHGDAETGPGLLDLAVNVRLPAPPPWLREALAASLRDLGAYPDPRAARAAAAARHGRDVEAVLPTAGAAEAFVLLARVLRPRRAVVVHPQFTEPEAALRAAGHDVERLVLRPPFVLRPDDVPDDADLVVVGNPTNPTGVLHADLAALARPGRVLVVDEAFLDAVPGEPGSLAGRPDLPGEVVVVRSLTKTWGLAGLRVGYLVAPPPLVVRLAEAQPLWALSTPACTALELCSAPAALAEAEGAAAEVAAERDRLEAALATVPGLDVSPGSRAPFLLVQTPGRPDLREALRARGVAVRRGDTFPGLGPAWFRVAVRGGQARERLLAALADALGNRS